MKRPERSDKLTIGVIGLGHVGLPTALGLAEMGWDVVGADDDDAKMESVAAGRLPFFEPGLQELLDRHLASGRFRPAPDAAATVRSASVVFVCVGTPQAENGQADLSQVEAVARVIARNLNGYKLIVEKSTVPVITAQWVKKTIERYAPAEAPAAGAFDVASNPEFLQEGQALKNFLEPDRIVVGVESDRARQLLEEIYRPLQRPLLFTDLATAELIKHAANAFLATKISFINAVADLCEAVGADVTRVAHGIGLDARIGPQFLRAGIGFGGYCLPKDLRAFIHLAEARGLDFALFKEVERINRKRIDVFVDKVRQALWVLNGKTLGVLGLAYKPGTDDIREAPSLKILERLLAEGARVRLHDPQAMENAKRVLPESDRVAYGATPYDVARGAHALLLLTEWDEFRQLDWPRLRQAMEVPVMIDGRNLYHPEDLQRAGFEYHSLGR
jgi:UDPglucose 6-dehydrogenase